MTQSNPYHEAASRGAALLDERNPGWWRRIDLDRLYLGICETCALGQVYGRYWPERDVGVCATDPSFGFHVGSGLDEVFIPLERHAKWEQLTEAWKSIIRARLEVDR